MKTNHKRGFVEKYTYNGGKHRMKSGHTRNARGGAKRTDLFSDFSCIAGPWCSCLTSRRLERSIHGAKRYVNSRMRFHGRMRIKQIIRNGEDWENV